jgi:hypothetical protein
METKTIMDQLAEALKDPAYRYGWQANIAMAFKDQMDYGNDDPSTSLGRHDIANKAAVRFLEQISPTKPSHSELDGMAAVAHDVQTTKLA